MRLQFERPIYGHTLEIAKLFTAFSDINSVQELALEYEYDADLQELVKNIEVGAKQSYRWNFVKNEVHKIDAPHTNNVVVCFSGGKDSTACAIKYRDLGYNVYLYYVKGINKSYPDEMDNAISISKYLNMPLHIEQVKQHGKTTFQDNPIKNQLIASMALDYAISNSIATDIAAGCFYTDSIDNSCFLAHWSDDVEMWEAHQNFVRKFVPNYTIHIPFAKSTETRNIIANDKNLLRMVKGCVLPQRFRAFNKQFNERKYGVELLPERCGSCWKCCAEYIYLVDIGCLPYNDAFYAHCLKLLKGKVKEIFHATTSDNISVVYNSFLGSDFENSLYYKKHNGLDEG